MFVCVRKCVSSIALKNLIGVYSDLVQEALNLSCCGSVWDQKTLESNFQRLYDCLISVPPLPYKLEDTNDHN